MLSRNGGNDLTARWKRNWNIWYVISRCNLFEQTFSEKLIYFPPFRYILIIISTRICRINVKRKEGRGKVCRAEGMQNWPKWRQYKFQDLSERERSEYHFAVWIGEQMSIHLGHGVFMHNKISRNLPEFASNVLYEKQSRVNADDRLPTMGSDWKLRLVGRGGVKRH